MVQSLNHEYQLSNATLIGVLLVLFRHKTIYPALILAKLICCLIVFWVTFSSSGSLPSSLVGQLLHLRG